MPDILHDLSIRAPVASVWRGVATPDGLDAWWTLKSSGQPEPGAEYTLDFGPGHEWHALVSVCEPERSFELQLVDADADWAGTQVGFELRGSRDGTHVSFHHRGWAAAEDHYRTSTFCWAMYLRILKRHLEVGETVPYELRLDA